MLRYILKRLIQAVITLVGITIIVFMLTHISGDPALLMAPPDATKEDIQELREQLGVTKPLYVQYGLFMQSVLKGEFGKSYKYDAPCIEVWMERFPNTIVLASAATAFTLLVGLPVGILSAVKLGTWFDKFGKVFALMGQSLPVFWVGLMLILIFPVTLGLLPTQGMGGLRHLVLPTITLGWYFTAAICRLSRSSMLDVLDSEYIKMARIKGVREISVIMKHAFRNALLPVVTLGALNLVFMLNGTVITETVFNWPGVGRMVVQAIFARDFPLVQATVLIGATFFVFANLFVDILYAYIDPRVSYQ